MTFHEDIAPVRIGQSADPNIVRNVDPKGRHVADIRLRERGNVQREWFETNVPTYKSAIHPHVTRVDDAGYGEQDAFRRWRLEVGSQQNVSVERKHSRSFRGIPRGR